MIKFNKVCVNDFETKEIFKMLREWTGLTQSEFAKTIGRTRDSVNNIENGRKSISVDEFFYICKKHHIILIVEKR